MNRAEEYHIVCLIYVDELDQKGPDSGRGQVGQRPPHDTLLPPHQIFAPLGTYAREGEGGNKILGSLPLSQCILDKDGHNLKETYCFVML